MKSIEYKTMNLEDIIFFHENKKLHQTYLFAICLFLYSHYRQLLRANQSE